MKAFLIKAKKKMTAMLNTILMKLIQIGRVQGRSLGRGFRGGAPRPWGSGGARPRGPRLAPVGPPRGRPTVAALAAV